MKISIENLAECIKRDPTSWNGMSLFYIRPLEGISSNTFEETLKEYTANWSEILLFHYANDNYILIGRLSWSTRLAEIAQIHSWISNIGHLWQQAVKIMDIATSQDKESLVSDKPSISDLSILVVEDDSMTSQIVARHLVQYGKVIVTSNAKQAIANNAVENPDIIFLDIHYKDDIYTGFDVLTNILSANPKAFVVMFSGDGDPTTIANALMSGAQGFITKPFYASHFAAYLLKFCRHK
jgi:CheY-like chemotaxis protein